MESVSDGNVSLVRLGLGEDRQGLAEVMFGYIRLCKWVLSQVIQQVLLEAVKLP